MVEYEAYRPVSAAHASSHSISRRDGRIPQQIRPLAAEPAALSRADGSARFAQGETEVLVSVCGPCEAKRARELIHSATIEVIVRPPCGLPGPAERETQQLLSQTLAHLALAALHPRTALSVVVQVVSDDGALLATALHGTCLALVHAGVPLSGLLGGCAAALLPDGTALLDPCADEEREAAAVVTFAYLVRRGADGSIERDQLLAHCAGCVARQAQFVAMQEASQEAAACSTAFMQQALTRVLQPHALGGDLPEMARDQRIDAAGGSAD